MTKGYMQTYGVVYHETFALMAKINIVRVLLPLVANFDWYLEQFDVKFFFLHDNLRMRYTWIFLRPSREI